ncbi:MAG: hypothetical protein LBK41_08445 [Clostridiales bacterium]|jgi:cell division protein FtsL|nr:hypothetical protein [Clostridiales bacterium]
MDKNEKVKASLSYTTPEEFKRALAYLNRLLTRGERMIYIGLAWVVLSVIVFSVFNGLSAADFVLKLKDVEIAGIVTPGLLCVLGGAAMLYTAAKSEIKKG